MRELCSMFGVASDMLPEVCFSDSLFGETDFAGYLPQPVPIHGVLGDSLTEPCSDRAAWSRG